ncbi:Nucleoside diphosphate-linked moiety X motif 19, mitochondrial [Geranomyces variabilis]|nr:Nucleoside diphosphate-linked moiety X motif 19, mitochondrial [Geranomyces variabilis]
MLDHLSAIVCAPVNAKEFKVLMLKRNSRGTFGSLHVFPGGMVDAVDSSPEWQTEHEKAASVNLSYFIAAIRETFEESGVLLTQPAPQMSSANLQTWRKKVHSDPRLFIEFCKAADIRPDVQGLIHWSNWITPPVEVSRFDTQFFLTVLNESHADTQCDGVETLELEWLTPQQAVDAFERGNISFFPPQYYTLLELSHLELSDLKDYVRGSRSRTPAQLVPMLPEPKKLADGKIALLLPGDEEYSPTLRGPKGRHHRLIARKEKGTFKELRLVDTLHPNSARL